MEQKTLKVEGMSCDHCVRAVTGALSALAGVVDVAVSLQNKTASFSYDPARVSIDTIKAAVVEEGFEVA